MISTLLAATLMPAGSPFLEPDVVVLREYLGAPGEQLGAITRSLGDLNGDGLDEWAACGPFYSEPGRELLGRVLVIDGRSGEVVREHVGPAPNTELTGPVVGPDLDGDGVPEYGLAAGAASSSGRAWIFRGDLSVPLRRAELASFSTASSEELTSVGESAGDVDGDGREDVFWLAEFADAEQGLVRIVSGADLETVVRTHGGDAPGDKFGNTAGTLGDLDGDGHDEYWIGAPQSSPPQTRGYVRVFDGESGEPLHELRPNAAFGAVFSLFYAYTADDVNGDGRRELFVADTGDYKHGFDTGRIYVFDPADGSKLWGRLGPAAHQGFGIGHPFGADVTGDGVDDLIVGSYLASDGAPDAGKVELLDGSDGTTLRTITSTTAGESFASDALGLGDLTGDGHPELAVAAWLNDEGGEDAGKVVVIRGEPLR